MLGAGRGVQERAGSLTCGRDLASRPAWVFDIEAGSDSSSATHDGRSGTGRRGEGRSKGVDAAARTREATGAGGDVIGSAEAGGEGERVDPAEDRHGIDKSRRGAGARRRRSSPPHSLGAGSGGMDDGEGVAAVGDVCGSSSVRGSLERKAAAEIERLQAQVAKALH